MDDTTQIMQTSIETKFANRVLGRYHLVNKFIAKNKQKKLETAKRRKANKRKNANRKLLKVKKQK